MIRVTTPFRLNEGYGPEKARFERNCSPRALAQHAMAMDPKHSQCHTKDTQNIYNLHCKVLATRPENAQIGLDCSITKISVSHTVSRIFEMLVLA